MSNSNRNQTARLAGLLYLILVISGIFNLMYIPSKLIVWENAAETLQNITESELLFRIGIVSGIVTFLSFMLLPLALYKLLSIVDKTYAALMVLFALISIPISFVNILNKFSILTLLEGHESTPVNPIELQSQVMFYLDSYNNGIMLTTIFWGLWLFPFGYLVYKSGFLPKVLGILLMLGCFGYLTDFFGNFLFSNYRGTMVASIAGWPGTIGEIGICLWLLIMGAKTFSFKRAGNTNNIVNH